MPLPFIGSDPGFGASLGLVREIDVGTLVFAVSALQGLLLAARFRVLILLPIVCLNLALIFVLWRASRSADLGLLLEQLAMAGIGVQMGYLVGQLGSQARSG